MKINLRLPPLLMGLCSMYVLFGCTRKYTASFATALSAVVFFACMPVSVFYMLYARGVMFELFFAITAFFSILFLLKTKKVKKYSFLFIASNVLGMYSMPSHLYFWATLSLVSLFYFILYEKELIKSFLISNLLILLLSILCYLPVLCGSGLSFILDATYNNIPSTNAVTNILFYSNGISNFFTSSPYGLLCLFIVSLAILVLCKKVGKGMLFLIVFAFILFLLPTFIYLIQHTFVPERALAFIGLVIPLLGCSVFYVFKNTFRQYSLYTTLVVLFLCGSFVSHKHDYLNWSVQKDRKAIVLSDLFMKEKIETCYDNAPNSDFYYFYPSLEYYFGEHKKLIQFNVAASNSLRYKQLSENDKYDCIIDSISADEKTRILKYKKIYADEMDGFKVWRLK
jgi:hypothetical protein